MSITGNKTKDILVFVSSKGCPNCIRIDTKVFKNKLKMIASEHGKEYLYIPLKANNSKISVEHPNLPRTLSNFTWFFPLFMVVNKDQWNSDAIINPYIMDGKVYENGKVVAIQRLPYPLNLTGVKNWLKDIKNGKITNRIESTSVPKEKTNDNKPKEDVKSDKKENATDSYKTSTPEDDLLGNGPFMNDSKIDEESHFCQCTIRPKNKAYRVKA